MRPSSLLWVLLVSGPLAIDAAPPQTTSGDWNLVEQAIEWELPQSAAEELDRILQSALARNDYPQAIKALCLRVRYETDWESQHPERRIVALEKLIGTMPAETRPILHVILAGWYLEYYEDHAWDLWRRTSVAGADEGDDLTAWSGARVRRELKRHIDAALTSAEALKRIPVSKYAFIIESGSLPHPYRPTLYDVLVHQAIDLCSIRQFWGYDMMSPSNAVGVSPSSPALGTADEFLAWKIEESDTPSVRQTFRLYQLLLRFHAADEDRSAWLDADFRRLRYASEVAVGPQAQQRYLAALKRFVADHSDHPIVTRAICEQAMVLLEAGRLTQALKTARRGKRLFPGSVGSRRCRRLIKEITRKRLVVETDFVWHPTWSRIRLHYRNLDRVYFRAVPVTLEECIEVGVEEDDFSPASIADAKGRELLLRKSAKEWSVKLPATKDYATGTHEVPIPDGLAAGPYVLLASKTESFADRPKQIVRLGFWRSDLHIVTFDREDGTIEGLVTSATTGEPLSDVEIVLRDPDKFTIDRRIASGKTDSDGRFGFSDQDRGEVLIHARRGGDELLKVAHASDRQDHENAVTDYVLLTDRAIYRPGDTIHYKGIAFQYDRGRSSYRVLDQDSVTVVLLDANSQEIASQTHRTNAFGSFHGSFIAPTGRLLGEMRIAVHGADRQATTIRVEEYKRPKFHVTWDAPEKPLSIGKTATVSGRVVSYSLAAVNGSVVRWRVHRYAGVLPHAEIAREPSFFSFLGSQFVNEGQSTADAAGRFTVSFSTAIPDDIPDDAPLFLEFTITAIVTNPTGEVTRTTHTVNATRPSLSATIGISQYQTAGRPVECVIRVRDGNNYAVSGIEGTLRFHRVIQPPRPQRTLGASSWFSSGLDWAHGTGIAPRRWKTGQLIKSIGLRTDASGTARTSLSLPAGAYHAIFETRDPEGRLVRTKTAVIVIEPDAQHFPVTLPFFAASSHFEAHVGDTLTIAWGSGYETARAYVEIQHGRQVLRRFWTEPGRTQQRVPLKITPAMRGGIVVRLLMVHDGQTYREDFEISVHWDAQQFVLKWKHFVSKLTPNQPETWSVTVKRLRGDEPVDAELVATMYDASLDRFTSLSWYGFDLFDPLETGHFDLDILPSNGTVRSKRLLLFSGRNKQTIPFRYPHLDSQLTHVERAAYERDREFGWRLRNQSWLADIFRDWGGFGIGGFGGFGAGGGFGGGGLGGSVDFDSFVPSMTLGVPLVTSIEPIVDDSDERTDERKRLPDPRSIVPRRNLSETAFFLPHIRTGPDGTADITFTPPEALTSWRVLVFAHDKQLRSGRLEATAVTSRPLMVRPNPPRFVREGDRIEFPVMVINRSDEVQRGTVRLRFVDAATQQPADGRLANKQPERSFEIKPRSTSTFLWKLHVPDGAGLLIYRATAAAADTSDGEEGYLPLLSRRLLVQESLALPIRGAGTRDFEWKALLDSAKSTSLQHHSLTVQVVSHPVWYSVMALPFLKHYPHDCSEQLFNKLYANLLGRHIVAGNPRIPEVIRAWQGTEALTSPLEKNTRIKNILLEESPWLRVGKSDSRHKRDLAFLLDDRRVDAECAALWDALEARRLSSGGWPWFSGGKTNRYITTYIVAGVGRLRKLGVDLGLDVKVVMKAVPLIDDWLYADYRRAKRYKINLKDRLTPDIAFGLYARSFFLEDNPVSSTNAAIPHFLDLAEKHWSTLVSPQSQGHLALALHRFGRHETAQRILASLRERAYVDEQRGMYWEQGSRWWYWHEAPIETQALLIEAFHEIEQDETVIDRCQEWLIKHAQTNHWKTTKATADACYALLVRGTSRLLSNKPLRITLAGRPIVPDKVEAGTGFYEQRFDDDAVKPELGRGKLEKQDDGVAWVSLHWQYFEDLSHIKATTDTPLSVEKRLFVKRSIGADSVLQPIDDSLRVGDELVVRLVVRTDRPLEFVHLKEQRGSGLEPVDVLSGYDYCKGTSYYRMTKDASTHFFFEQLPKGTYVLEYSARVQHRGNFESGIAEIQCMYAPELAGHSGSVPIHVGE